jgi:hypothetical protein
VYRIVSMRRTALLLVLLVAAFGIVAAGCGQEQEQTATPETVEGELTTEATETETTETDTTETETTETETETETTETETTPALEGLRRVPYAGRRRCNRRSRTEPRRVSAERRSHCRSRDERSGRDARLLEHPQRAADRRRRCVRLVGRRLLGLLHSPRDRPEGRTG